MSTTRGGRRPGAGRKPGVQFKTRIELMATIFTPEDWAALLKHLYKRAMSDGPDSTRAAIALLRYQFGDKLCAYDEFDLQRAGLIPPDDGEDEVEDDEHELDGETAEELLDRAEQLLNEIEQVGVPAASSRGARPIFHTPDEIFPESEFDEFAAIVANAKESPTHPVNPSQHRLKDRRERFQRRFHKNRSRAPT